MDIYQARKILFDPLAWKLSKNEIHRWMLSNRSIEEIVSAARGYTGRGFYADIHAAQRDTEIIELTHIVEQIQPRIIVEIGTHRGGTFFIWCRSFPQLELIVSLDLPSGAFGGGYDHRRIKLYREFLFDRPHAQSIFLRCDSHAPGTLQRIETILDKRPIDFLFIDGDHTYSGIKRDFEMYAPLVRHGGIIAFHDIVTRVAQHEVYIFWNEVKLRFRHQELIQNPNGKMGIGILYVE
jgi:predicted O-methyltransferase YrrM